jgi:hypothetical protein
MRGALIAIVLAACQGQVGTLSVSLATAPGSAVLDNAQSLKLVLTNPHEVITAQRDPSGGFSIELDLPASNSTGVLIADALDAGGNLVASGSTPILPLGAVDATVVIYMAAPNTIGGAPVALSPARSDLAAGPLSYGAIFAGGRDATGAAKDSIAVYNTYDHSLVAGLALPEARAGLALGVGANGVVYLFGGDDPSGNPSGQLWRFDTNVSPAGAYTDYGDKTGFARVDQLAVPLGDDQFLVTGTPVALLSGLDGSMVARTEFAALPAAGTSVVATDGATTAIFAGAMGVVRFRNGAVDMVDTADHTGATVAALPGGRVLVACGTGAAVVIDAAAGVAQPLPGVPATARTGCAIAASTRHVVIAGGTAAGAVADTAEVYDAGTLAAVATPMMVVPRTGAIAIALPNDQVLIAGGTDKNAAPTETIELFTPEPTE